MSKMRSDLSDRNIKQCCWSEQALLAYVSYWIQVVKVQWTQQICSEKIIIVATDRENKKIVWVVVDENKILLYNF